VPQLENEIAGDNGNDNEELESGSEQSAAPVQWVECTTCHRDSHLACYAGVKADDDSEPFVCEQCRTRVRRTEAEIEAEVRACVLRFPSPRVLMSCACRSMPCSRRSPETATRSSCCECAFGVHLHSATSNASMCLCALLLTHAHTAAMRRTTQSWRRRL
jgi:hypothetical protein